MLEAQKNDEKIFAIIKQIGNGKETEFTVNEKGVLYYKDWVCVPDDNDLRKAILKRHIVNLLLSIPVAQRCTKI